jgi:hypothetical protein
MLQSNVGWSGRDISVEDHFEGSHFGSGGYLKVILKTLGTQNLTDKMGKYSI